MDSAQAKRHRRDAAIVIAIAGGILLVGSTLADADRPPAGNDPARRATYRAMDPEARKTFRAERRATVAAMSPEERATMRAKRARDGGPRGPGRQGWGAAKPGRQQIGGKPVAGNCPQGAICSLSTSPEEGQVLILTSAWNAESVECDGVKVSTPANGQPIAPLWRCEKSLSIRGTGAGYTAYSIAK